MDQPILIHCINVDELNVGFSASQKGIILVKFNELHYALERDSALYLAKAIVETIEEADKQFANIERMLLDAQIKEQN